ncbi:hypothetical protein JW872_01955 [Candidatus Babeliales bacterium]|nr:hypothetical protein [Candidatus Babeliales bacterium]
MNTPRVFGLSVAVWFVGYVFRILTCGWLFTWVYMIPPHIWVDPQAMMQLPSLVGMNLISWLHALMFVVVYAFVNKYMPFKGVTGGLLYGLGVTLVSSFGMLTMPFYMTIAPTVVIYWVLQGLILNMVNGAIMGKWYRL